MDYYSDSYYSDDEDYIETNDKDDIPYDHTILVHSNLSKYITDNALCMCIPYGAFHDFYNKNYLNCFCCSCKCLNYREFTIVPIPDGDYKSFPTTNKKLESYISRHHLFLNVLYDIYFTHVPLDHWYQFAFSVSPFCDTTCL